MINPTSRALPIEGASAYCGLKRKLPSAKSNSAMSRSCYPHASAPTSVSVTSTRHRTGLTVVYTPCASAPSSASASSTSNPRSIAAHNTPARALSNKLPVTALNLIHNQFIPTFDVCGATIETVLSDNRREFCRRPHQHSYELFLQFEEVEHRTRRSNIRNRTA
jgi:hypothetical protein